MPLTDIHGNENHLGCPDPYCCECECRACKRAWFELDRPQSKSCPVHGVTSQAFHVLEDMSQLKLNPSWTLELSTADLRLVLMALGGRLKPEHMEAARTLGDQLTRDRVKGTQAELDKLRKNLSES